MMSSTALQFCLLKKGSRDQSRRDLSFVLTTFTLRPLGGGCGRVAPAVSVVVVRPPGWKPPEEGEGHRRAGLNTPPEQSGDSVAL